MVITGLEAALSDADPIVRQMAVRALGSIPNITPPLATKVALFLRDQDPEMRNEAAMALYNVGTRAVVHLPELVAALDDPSESVVVSALCTIRSFGPAASPARNALEKAARDERPLVASTAQAALGMIQSSKSNRTQNGDP
jgi:HEAT repeat protein